VLYLTSSNDFSQFFILLFKGIIIELVSNNLFHKYAFSVVFIFDVCLEFPDVGVQFGCLFLLFRPRLMVFFVELLRYSYTRLV
jgi:hypothetical protein